jgi:cyanate lyase
MHRQKGVWEERGWRMDTEDIIPCTEDMRIYLFYEMTQVYYTRMLQVNCDTPSLHR